MLFAGIAQITAVAGGDAAVRDRYVAVMLDGLRARRRHRRCRAARCSTDDLDRLLERRARGA